MAVKKAAPKKAATSTFKHAKKAVNSAKPSVKTAKKAMPASKVLAKTSPKKTANVPVKKAAVAKHQTILKTPISRKSMAKKETVTETKSKKEEVKFDTKKSSEAAPKKAARPVSKKQPETQAEVNRKASSAPVAEVKAPKTTIKTSVPYHPEYKTLDQRHTSTNGNGNVPLVRYNDNELNEFRELINKKLDAAKKELAYLQGLITRRDDLGGDETDNRYMTMEDGSMSMEREQLSQMASRQITYIDHLEKALIRIENKTYGICRVTGKLIDKARLRAVPHATLSLEAKLGLVKPGTE